MTSYKQILIEEVGAVTIVTFKSDQLIDHMVLTDVQEDLLAVAETEPSHLLIDFTDVEFCSTSLINALLRVRRKATEQQTQLRLCQMQPTVRDAFQMLNLDGTIFDIHEYRRDALDAFED